MDHYLFLEEILGQCGAQALKKASDRSPEVESILVPRAIIAWLDLQDSFDGPLPGIENSHLNFQTTLL